VVAFAVLFFDGRSLERRFNVEVPRREFKRVVLSLSLANNGDAIVPHAEGAAHVRSDGSVVHVYPAGKMKHWGSRASISPNARWIAATASSGAIDVHDLEQAKTTRRNLEMDDVTSLRVHDDGTIDAAVATPKWDFQRVSPSGEVLRINAGAAFYATSPDRASIYSAKDQQLVIWNLRAELVRTLPLIGGQRGSRIIATHEAVYVRSSTGVFQRMRL
jgi:hypothetical protein